VLTAFSLRTKIVESLIPFGKEALLHISARKRLVMQEQLNLRNQKRGVTCMLSTQRNSSPMNSTTVSVII